MSRVMAPHHTAHETAHETPCEPFHERSHEWSRERSSERSRERYPWAVNGQLMGSSRATHVQLMGRP